MKKANMDSLQLLRLMLHCLSLICFHIVVQVFLIGFICVCSFTSNETYNLLFKLVVVSRQWYVLVEIFV